MEESGLNRQAAQKVSATPWPARINTWLLKPWFKPAAFVLCLWPLASLVWAAFNDQLGANPAEALIRATGDWTLRALCLTLALTPLRQLFGLNGLARLRRMFGLYAFFYGLIHFLSFAWLDMGFDFPAIVQDIIKRPFILVGSTTLLLMLPLAATSANRVIKAMGAKRWTQLHKLVYLIVILGLLHFFWVRSGKNDFAEVAVYGLVIVFLLGWRVWKKVRAKP